MVAIVKILHKYNLLNALGNDDISHLVWHQSINHCWFISPVLPYNYATFDSLQSTYTYINAFSSHKWGNAFTEGWKTCLQVDCRWEWGDWDPKLELHSQWHFHKTRMPNIRNSHWHSQDTNIFRETVSLQTPNLICSWQAQQVKFFIIIQDKSPGMVPKQNMAPWQMDGEKCWLTLFYCQCP